MLATETRMRVEPAADGLCVRTRCRTVEEFVLEFEQYASRDSLFIPALADIDGGGDKEFVVLLADDGLVLHGQCAVRRVWSTSQNPFRVPGILIRVRSLAPGSAIMFARLRSGADGTVAAPIVDAPTAPVRVPRLREARA